MLELMNLYLHGYVAIPVILACRENGLFDLTPDNKRFTLKNLSKTLKANEGHLAVALRMFESLNWLKRDGNSYEFTIDEGSCEFIKLIPKKLMSLYKVPFNTLLQAPISKRKLNAALQELLKCSYSTSSWHLDFLHGVVIVPLLLAIKNYFQGNNKEESQQFENLPEDLKPSILKFFFEKEWITQQGKTLILTPMGQSMMERAFVMATIASYAPMLSNISELLFGDPKKVFKNDKSGHELHIDRTLNVLGSGFQHKRYFEDVEQLIVAIFNQLPYEAQPKYIIDMGCGDGTFLKRIYEIICENSARGKVIDQYPIYMIGVDFNQKALEATKTTLKEIPHYTLKGDIADPERLLQDLKILGLSDCEKSLHVRSFLDHDRPFSYPHLSDAMRICSRISYEGVYVDKEGKNIPPAIAVESLVEHLGRWASIATQHGLIVLEVHALAPKVVAAYFNQSENFHFDAYHAFSMQHLVEAETFLISAAEVGLFPNPSFARHYPQILPYTRITLNYFQKKPYTVAYAHIEDLPKLVQLEAECWTEALRMPEEVLRSRLEQYPQGQFVIKLEDEIIGAVYTQRIENLEVLYQITHNQVAELRRNDGPIVQLLNFNILPAMQNRGFGDQVLEFILQLCSLKGGVEKIVGVTRCKNYKDNTHLSLKAYINQHLATPEGLDPILRFHTSHGAKIRDILSGYRIEDIDNQGAGILIEYEIHKQAPKLSAQPNISLEQSTSSREKEHHNITQKEVYACIQRLIPQKNASHFLPTRPLQEMGFDSLGLLELKSLLNKTFNLNLDSTFFFTYASPFAIAEYFIKQLDITNEHAVRPSAIRAEQVRDLRVAWKENNCSDEKTHDIVEPIAIVGMACRFPSDINTPQEFWAALENGKDMIGKPAPTRPSTYFHPLVPSEGGYINNVDQFAATFFNISRREAESMDPQQRLLLEVSWEAFENAGINTNQMRETMTSVFVGIIGCDYRTLLNNQGVAALNGYFGTGTHSSIASGRLSYIYGLRGPALSVDTACSSSLVAINLACQSLRQKQSNLSLVGGVNLILSPEYSIAFENAGMLSQDYRCKTFDVTADGYVRSEGCGVILLKTLSQALADRDNILALIKSSVVNQDGASNGLTAPNKTAQEELLMAALSQANISPHSISYIEAHGSGTILGDPIEVNAIKTVYGKDRANDNPLLLGSVKTNIGHTEGASGIAGLMKVVLSLQNRKIPPHLHFTRLNPHIDLSNTAIEIPTKLKQWKQSPKYPRRAAVSSFGFSGTNCHIILEEAPEIFGPCAVSSKPYYLITLSAKHDQSLYQKIADLDEWLKDHPQAKLEDIAYTLNVGRAHFNYRCVFVVGSIEELKSTIKQARNKEISENYLMNLDKNKAENNTLSKVIENLQQEIQEAGYANASQYRQRLMALADFYIKGYDIDWKMLHQGEANIRILLPTYPFLRNHYWLPHDAAREFGIIKNTEE